VRTASGVREVPQARGQVWQALAVLGPYCAVCDVTYVVRGTGTGTTFVCVPGRGDGAEPGADALRGEIVEWQPRRLVATRLQLPAETWTTRIELADTAGGGTRVTMTLGFESPGERRLVERVQGRARQRLVQRTLDAELDKVPAHIALGADAG
jgi:Polyketide cyclase / dehydrase and lipid transport